MVEVIGEVTNNSSVDSEKNKYNRLDTGQGYIHNLYSRYEGVRKTIMQLDLIAKLSAPRSVLYLNKHLGVKYSEFATYNMENFVTRCISAFEQSLVFISEFYKLNIPPKSVDLNKVRNHEYMQNRKVITFLNDINIKLQRIRDIRNNVIHHGTYKDNKIKTIEANLSLLAEIPEEYRNAPEAVRMFDLVDKLVEEIYEFMERIFRYMSAYYVSLDHILFEDIKTN